MEPLTTVAALAGAGHSVSTPSSFTGLSLSSASNLSPSAVTSGAAPPPSGAFESRGRRDVVGEPLVRIVIRQASSPALGVVRPAATDGEQHRRKPHRCAHGVTIQQRRLRCRKSPSHGQPIRHGRADCASPFRHLFLRHRNSSAPVVATRLRDAGLILAPTRPPRLHFSPAGAAPVS